MQILPPFVVSIYGSSESTGRLSADWVPRLDAQIRTFPECKGPVTLLNMGKGGQTSVWGLENAPGISALRPSHILTEGFAINDCVDFGSGPAVSPATHIADIQGMFAEWRAHIPGVDITLQTMNSVSLVQSARTALGSYYADEIATANAAGVRVLDNYAGWPNPLAQNLTYIDASTGQGDGLHPIWAGAVDTYLFPNVVAWARARMAAYWPN